MFDVEVFAARLKKMRQSKELTTVQVAKGLGVNSATISKWENALIKPTADSLVLIATFFNVTAGYLLGMED